MDSEEEFVDYHFIKDEAYTEDDELVYNVLVYNVPGKTTKAEFLEYFVKFGEIVSVHLLDVCNQTIGFANFKDPVSAAKVLKKADHTIKGNTIYVTACHSWHQPDEQPTATSTAADDEMETNVSSLLNLNDDCLDIIFKYLEIKEETNLAGCCCRLRDVFIMRAKVRYKILDLKYLDYLPLWQVRNFLQMVGPHIEKLNVHLPSHDFESEIEFIGIYCVNVKSISMYRQNLSANSLRKLLRNTYLVEVLNLDHVELKDESIPVLKKLKNLNKLSLDDNNELTGHGLECLTTVNHLSLHLCKAFKPTFFKNICENLKDLKYLDIRECDLLNTSSVHDVVKHLKKLETLKLKCDVDQTGCVASLPNLKNLHFQSYKTVVPMQMFEELAKLKADQLEVLHVKQYCENAIEEKVAIFIGELRNLKQLCYVNSNINDNCLQNLSKLHELELLEINHCNGFTATGLLDLIQKCRKLKTLNVSGCEHLDEKFATKLLELLISERRQRNENKPLKLFAICSRIQRSAVESPPFKEASDVLIFKC